jgi:hypothetical protein
MATAEERQAAIDKAVAQVSVANGFMRPAAAVSAPSTSATSPSTQKAG